MPANTGIADLPTFPSYEQPWADISRQGPLLGASRLISDTSSIQFTSEQDNTAIADISDFQHTNMPANTDIAILPTFQNYEQPLAGMSARTAPGTEPPCYCYFFKQFNKKQETPLQHQNASKHRYCRLCRHLRHLGNHGPAYVGRARSWGRTTLLLSVLPYNPPMSKKYSYCRHFRFPTQLNARKHRYCRLVRLVRLLGNHGPTIIQVRNADISDFHQ